MHAATFASLLGLTVWALAIWFTLRGTKLALKLHRSSPPHLDAPFNLFPVSIIKPLKGVDGELVKNLESFFRLDYPDYELLFCVAHANDPACDVVNRLMARFPLVRTRLNIGEIIVGPNPKVNNMIRSYEKARHDWILISDSNVWVPADYLKRMVAHLEPGVGMVTSVVAGRRAGGVGGNLEATYLNTFYARGMSLAAEFGRVCVVGKSMLFQRSVAKRFGGLRALGRYLAEDFMAGEAMQRLGLKVVMAVDPISQIIGAYSLDSFWSRHLRWGRIRKKHAFLTFILEPWLGSLVSGVLGAASMWVLLGVPMYWFLAVHLMIWSLCDGLLMRTLRTPIKWSTPIYWFLREATALPLWIQVASSNTVKWQGHLLEIRSGGLLES